MNYPVSTSAQLKAVLRALRKDRQLSQADLGQRIGVNQKRVARIEGEPGVTSFDQIARIVSALGGRLVVEQESAAPSPHLPARRLPARRGKSDRASKSAHSW
jgi:HTH-type transcriptional regulator/antitoxin HipB